VNTYRTQIRLNPHALFLYFWSSKNICSRVEACLYLILICFWIFVDGFIFCSTHFFICSTNFDAIEIANLQACLSLFLLQFFWINCVHLLLWNFNCFFVCTPLHMATNMLITCTYRNVQVATQALNMKTSKISICQTRNLWWIYRILNNKITIYMEKT
jgi:hypothetical protein